MLYFCDKQRFGIIKIGALLQEAVHQALLCSDGIALHKHQFPKYKGFL